MKAEGEGTKQYASGSRLRHKDWRISLRLKQAKVDAGDI